jgi:transposase-like protein
MPRPYSDDLRRKILQAYEQGNQTREQVAERFRVSVGFVKKIRRQQLRTGQMERRLHHPRTQAQVHRAHSPTTARKAATRSDPGGVAGEASPAVPGGGESALRVGSAAEDGAASEEKSVHAQEQESESVQQRQAFRQTIPQIEDWRWVFVDETWFNTQMGLGAAATCGVQNRWQTAACDKWVATRHNWRKSSHVPGCDR